MTLTKRASCLVLPLLLASALLAGCSSSSPGGGGETIVEPQQQTYGQQLIDLKTARDKGIISEKEYEKSRKAIIKKMDD